MKAGSIRHCTLVIVAVVTGLITRASANQEKNWDGPAIDVFPDHNAFAVGTRPLPELIEAGRRLFRASFNVLDGAGRPGATGDSKPTIRLAGSAPLLQRIAGPDATSCAGCHNLPIIGGSGDFSSNVFVGAHFSDPPSMTIEPQGTNERGTTSVFGAGAIEMVAREMTDDLHAQLDAARINVADARHDEQVSLVAKGVSFGKTTVHPDGSYSSDDLEGIDSDLVVKPFGVKGIAVSLREFTNFALNQHHGIQSEERFGWARTGIRDFDDDGVVSEFTIGQLSALVIYQASLPPPRRVRSSNPAQQQLVESGEMQFNAARCTSCHLPYLPLRSSWFLEPNPYNRPGSIVPSDVGGQITLPIEVEDDSGIVKSAEGAVLVRAFTDLKRHVICDEEDDFYCNERLRQDFVPRDQFLTAKLWDAGSSAPYGHRGNLTTITEAIMHHSGEGKGARRAFAGLSDEHKRSLIAFLKSLRVTEDMGQTQEKESP